ncbi:MAG TPA: YMGG-like glycine zipper-containing protein [Flavobacterium sp.]|jgi:hypothetical protein
MKKILLIPVIALTMLSCKDNANQAMTYDDKQSAIDSMEMVVERQKIELEKQRAIDSVKLVMAEQEARQKPVVVQHVAASQPAAATAAQPQRKKWSATAKGAVIGAGVGAVSGAIIDKDKPAKGALIGGLIGAGAGAGTGAIIDAEKKKKQ